MAVIFILNAVLHTTALTGKTGAWNVVLTKRYQARAHVYKHAWFARSVTGVR